MTRIRSTAIPILGVLVMASSWPGAARAQDEEDREQYQEPLHYGLREAARQGRSIQLGGAARPTVAPELYTVRRGDTLWDICDLFFANPWQWPRIWSFNERITNPNWIYPGDPIRLRRPGEPAEPTPGLRPGSRVVPEQVYLRDEGFVERDRYRKSGVIVGSPDERTLLSWSDELYVEFEDPREIVVGREYTVFRQVRSVAPGPEAESVGSIVEILGTIKINSYDRDRNVARAVITESLQPIERGHRVAPIERTFAVTPPLRNETDVVATVLASLSPVQNIAEQQVVFLNRGGLDGVRNGNRFFVVRRGDAYQRSIDEEDLRSGFPYEVIAELRVVNTRRHTSTCLVIRATREVNSGDRAEMRRGY